MRNWDDIRYFLAVARTGAVTSAARLLEVNHSTVSRRIDQMEKNLNVRLFDRFQSGYRITDAGEEIFQLAEKMEQDAVAIERHLKGRDLAPSGHLKIATVDTAVVDLTAYYASFINSYPAIELDVVASGMAANLEQMEADIAIRLTNAPPEDLVGKEVTKVAFAAYASKDYLSRKPKATSLLDYDWIEWVAESKQQMRYQAAREKFSEVKVVLKANAPNILFEATRKGIGVGVLPCHVAKTDSNLVQLDIPEAKIVIGLWLLTHRDLRSTKRVRLFIDDLSQQIAMKSDFYESF